MVLVRVASDLDLLVLLLVLLTLLVLLYVASDLVATTAKFSHAVAGRKARCGAHDSRAGIWLKKDEPEIRYLAGSRKPEIGLCRWIGIGMQQQCDARGQWEVQKRQRLKAWHVKEMWKRG